MKWFIAMLLFPALLFSADSLTCDRVIDGDTIHLSDGETVRLIGVDTPETDHPLKPVEYFGIEAKKYTTDLVRGKTVTMKYDQTREDRYGRTLAYVYLPDGRCINAELIKQGYGFAYVKYPFEKMEEYLGYEKGAREAGAGLWAGTEDVKKYETWDTVYITNTGTKYHREDCRFLDQSKIPVSKDEAIDKGYTPCEVCDP